MTFTSDATQVNTADYDYLTGLFSRRGLYSYYASLDKERIVHAMFIDIDNFKHVNDVYGHSMGDNLLIDIGKLIRSYARGFTSRIGGDEYVVLSDGSMPEEQVLETAKQLIENMPGINSRKDVLSLISLSIGIVLEQPVSQSLDDVLAKCDAAMYQAKYDGKNQYTVYKAYDKTLEINRNIELEMEDALKNGEFQVYLQPKVNMITSQLYGAEGLSRWVHPVDGVRPPIMYIPLFEKNGFISKLDMYIFEEVCRLKSEWVGKRYAHIPISVNMSRLHLYDHSFPETLENIAKKYNVPTKELEIEVTESIFIKDTKELIQTVDNLRSRGFLVSIDDFGSGFSALNLLKDLTVDTIKLDRHFLQVSANTTRGKKVIRNVISLCRDLKMDVVTEGVETKEQIDFITSCGCPIAQGFYYAKPLAVPEFLDFAEEYSTAARSSYSFRFNGSLQSEDGTMEATIFGEGLTFEEGIFKDSKAIRFPGGLPEQNTIHLPRATVSNDSFTVSMWIRPEVIHPWTSAFYVKFETGFCSIIPYAWDSVSDLRIRDSKEVDGWYDISACPLLANQWSHYAFSYNAKSETATAFINGDVVGVMYNVPTNRFAKLIILGGDVFQPSLVGSICEVEIYNEPKDYDFIKDLHHSYTFREDFTGFIPEEK